LKREGLQFIHSNAYAMCIHYACVYVVCTHTYTSSHASSLDPAGRSIGRTQYRPDVVSAGRSIGREGLSSVAYNQSGTYCTGHVDSLFVPPAHHAPPSRQLSNVNPAALSRDAPAHARVCAYVCTCACVDVCVDSHPVHPPLLLFICPYFCPYVCVCAWEG
jgi:hypothetical protein